MKNFIMSLTLFLLIPTSSVFAGLIVEYNFNGNALDSSGNGLHASVNGASLVADRFGNLNSAYQFDGNDQITSDSNFTDVWNNWTVDFWVKLNSVGSYMTFIEREQVGSFQDLEIGVANSGNLWLETDNSTPSTVLSSNLLNTNEWYNITVTYDGTSKRMFINGVLDTITSDPNAQVSLNAPLRIGYHSNAGSRQYLDGILDDIRIFDSVEAPHAVPGPKNALLVLVSLMMLRLLSLRRSSAGS